MMIACMSLFLKTPVISIIMTNGETVYRRAEGGGRERESTDVEIMIVY